ncbi:MAG: hypothetical protein J6R32_10880 [Bacteroidales bacterium]|jgi:hypothetical protein|nr:hypothetical protein [Bacteroidales bacterium]
MVIGSGNHQPVIIMFADGTEKWFPTISAAAREIGMSGEALRLLLISQRFKQSRQTILGAWYSDYNKNKIEVKDNGRTKTIH